MAKPFREWIRAARVKQGSLAPTAISLVALGLGSACGARSELFSSQRTAAAGQGGVGGGAGRGPTGGTAGGNPAGAGGSGGAPCGAGAQPCPKASCANGIVEAGEECDDENLVNGDGCSASCRWEPRAVALSDQDFACALGFNGRVKCWGSNRDGELGLGDSNDRGDQPSQMGDNLPAVELGGGRTVQAISAYRFSACALLDGGSIKCWGADGFGALGLGDMDDHGDQPGEMGDNLPTLDLGTGRTASMVAAGATACAVLDNGALKCWGLNQYGQLGLGDTRTRGDEPGEMGDNLPAVDLGTGRTATAVATGGDMTCALLDDGSVKCWGYNGWGNLGLGDTATRGDDPTDMGDNLPAVDLGTGRTATAIAVSDFTACALLDDRSLKCWGANDYAQLGLGDGNARGDQPNEMGDQLPAIDLGTGRFAVRVAPSNIGTCALLDDASIRCWGTNQLGALGFDASSVGAQPGQMGDNLPIVELGAGRSARSIATTEHDSCALLDDGTVKCWGVDREGLLGAGNSYKLPSAVTPIDLTF